ncbi:hypothetical protein LAV73_01680 [Lysinibacillus xylanilyticus]|uniref:hypothetical protein n=1 Tax=Lysinibacillus xylanilyticus TaxID=582475 RepID=UPI002B2424B7|nr:hypothetical protein [Lysinibacillus xylanilyticus]MEB2278718.1 hypothetical protein [Lysinibacillus xylanilyticus]
MMKLIFLPIIFFLVVPLYRCTWDDDYKNVTQTVRKQLLQLAQVKETNYTAVLMQGSGSFVVESVLTTTVGEGDKILIITNGAYGERGIRARYARYANNNHLLRSRLKALGFNAYISEELQSPIITTFLFPYEGFSFEHFYGAMKKLGFVIYLGKLTDVDTFRIDNIGDIHEDDMTTLCKVIENYMAVMSNEG